MSGHCLLLRNQKHMAVVLGAGLAVAAAHEHAPSV
jgi:hypothetical protein